MRIARRLVLGTLVAAALGTAAPAQAWELPVTVEFNGPVNCVTWPCPQPTPVTVCVKGHDICTPR